MSVKIKLSIRNKGILLFNKQNIAFHKYCPYNEQKIFVAIKYNINKCYIFILNNKMSYQEMKQRNNKYKSYI